MEFLFQDVASNVCSVLEWIFFTRVHQKSQTGNWSNSFYVFVCVCNHFLINVLILTNLAPKIILIACLQIGIFNVRIIAQACILKSEWPMMKNSTSNQSLWLKIFSFGYDAKLLPLYIRWYQKGVPHFSHCGLGLVLCKGVSSLRPLLCSQLEKMVANWSDFMGDIWWNG